MSSDNSIREILYNKFKLGMTPTADDFEELIDAATNASTLVTGTLDNNLLADTVEANQFSGGFIGDGAQLNKLNADNISDGTLNNARLPKLIDLDAILDEDQEVPTQSSFKATQATLVTLDAETLNATADVNASRFIGQSSTLTGHLKAATLEGDGESIHNLDPKAFKEGKISVNNLPDGTVNARGILRLATTQDVVDARDDRAVTAELLKQSETNIDQAIAEQKDRIDAILDSSSADKDSFAEIVTLINEVDTESDQVFGSYVISNNDRSTQIESDLATEIASRISGDDARFSNVESDARYLQSSGGSIGGALTVDGATLLQSGLQVTGAITASDDITAFSDERLKENIQPIDQALERTLQLEGVTFTRKDLNTEQRFAGVIAQQVQQAFPEVVYQNDDYLSVAYGNMVALLIESIKALNNKVEHLQDQLAELTTSTEK